MIGIVRLTNMFFAPTFFQSVKAAAEKLSNLQIFYETPVTDLVVDAESGEVRGVTVKNADESTSNYKALKGVVMACGSFEASDYYIENYCYDPMPELYPPGTPYNTGDGIAIAQKAGARMRHMAGLEFGAYCFRQPSQALGTTIAMNNRWEDLDHLVAVNKNGKRFMNEAGATQTGALPRPGHDKTTLPELTYDGIAFEYANLPFWFVFDSERFAHSLGTWADSSATSGWTTRHSLYVWSEDNSAEVEKGWILKADTLADLASQMGVDAAALEATIDEYNKGCESGADAFGRTESLTPVAKGPFYATDMALAFINAQGGPERNENYQVIGSNGEPIPRLYAAGEFGSIWGHDYHGGVNVPEAICGFAAGEQVADLESWA